MITRVEGAERLIARQGGSHRAARETSKDDQEPEVVVVEEEEPAEEEDHMKPIVVRVPRTPTEKEREVHEATHLPHAEWCDYCVRGRGRNKAHRRKAKREGERTKAKKLVWQEVVDGEEEEASRPRADVESKSPEKGVPRVSMDYFFLGGE